MGKILYISGFNGHPEIQKSEEELSNQLGFEKIDYYPYYDKLKLDSRPLITAVVDAINRAYFSTENNQQPLTIVAWSLGGCILSEALNIIVAQNKMAEMNNEPEAIIHIEKTILFSPAWYITDLKGLITPVEYATEEAKTLGQKSRTWATSYILKKPKVLYYLFNISKNSDNKSHMINSTEEAYSLNEAETGIKIISQFNPAVILPENDEFINVGKTEEVCKKHGIPVNKIGAYGHMAPVVPGILEELLKPAPNKRRR